MEWHAIETAPTDGTQCALRFRDPLGWFELDAAHFLHDDGFWYRIDPPMQITGNPTHWRPHAR
jgi:hypothetical protein